MEHEQHTRTGGAPCIGVFDSGIGGLSVLRALRRRMPFARLMYVADSGHAPYGEREDSFILERSLRIVRHLQEQGAAVLVMACNTATAAAADALRRELPRLRLVGVEPGIKPAVSVTRNGRIGVMATTSTLSSVRFRRLVQAHGNGARFHFQACTGLAKAIEGGDTASAEIKTLIDRYTEPFREAGVDTVVMGCTHYPLVADEIQSALGRHVRLIDTSDAVARRAQLVAATLGVDATDESTTPVRCWTSGRSACHLQQVAKLWLDSPTEVFNLPAS